GGGRYAGGPGWHERRRTGIEPARPRDSASSVLKTAGTTRHPDASTPSPTLPTARPTPYPRESDEASLTPLGPVHEASGGGVEAFALRDDGVLGVGGGGAARGEDGEARAERAGRERDTGQSGERTAATGDGCEQAAADRQGPRGAHEPARPSRRVRLADEAEPALHHPSRDRLHGGAEHGHGTGRTGLGTWGAEHAGRPGGGHRAAREEERQLPVGLVPDGHGGVGDQDGGVGGGQRPDHRAGQQRPVAGERQDPGH